jgi:hydroxymethylpyrimidine kinase/phosphomethylpyrimidine kinase
MTEPQQPRVLVIAGSDSSGGAGIEADIKVLTAHRVYATTAITALTAQNTLGVKDVHKTPVEFVEKCIDAVMDDVGTNVLKTGKTPSTDRWSNLLMKVKECYRARNISNSSQRQL